MWAVYTFTVNAMKHKKKTWTWHPGLIFWVGISCKHSSMSVETTGEWWGATSRSCFSASVVSQKYQESKEALPSISSAFLRCSVSKQLKGKDCSCPCEGQEHSLCYFEWLFLTSTEHKNSTGDGTAGTLALKTWPSKRPFLGKFSQTGWMQSETCCICPIQCTYNMVIPMFLTALKETGLSCFLLELKFGILLRHPDFLCRNRIYIDTINHA